MYNQSADLLTNDLIVSHKQYAHGALLGSRGEFRDSPACCRASPGRCLYLLHAVDTKELAVAALLQSSRQVCFAAEHASV